VLQNRLGILQKLLREETGQDLIEYALLGGFVSVAVGAVFPYLAGQIGTILSKAKSVLDNSYKTG
jgi:pilus assembly protein Flp/PilA